MRATTRLDLPFQEKTAETGGVRLATDSDTDIGAALTSGTTIDIARAEIGISAVGTPGLPLTRDTRGPTGTLTPVPGLETGRGGERGTGTPVGGARGTDLNTGLGLTRQRPALGIGIGIEKETGRGEGLPLQRRLNARTPPIPTSCEFLLCCIA